MVSFRKSKTLLLVLMFPLCFILSAVWLWKRNGFWSHTKKSMELNDDYKTLIDHIDVNLSTETVLSNNKNENFLSRIVYNRVGKCGSRTMQNIIRVLSKKNSFNFYLSPLSNDTRPKLNFLIEEIKLINSIASPMLYSRHIHYINFRKFGLLSPVYINLIRDPIERFSSNYHFKRFGDMINNQGRQAGLSDHDRYMNINDCILKNHSECMTNGLWYMIPYFCGQEAFCRTPSVEALRRAKMNVLDNYIAVGILEDFEGSLKVFEKLLPQHFSGVTQVYNDFLQDSNRKNTSTIGKKRLSEKAIAVLRSRMHYDYDFYYFVIALFKNLKKKLSII